MCIPVGEFVEAREHAVLQVTRLALFLLVCHRHFSEPERETGNRREGFKSVVVVVAPAEFPAASPCLVAVVFWDLFRLSFPFEGVKRTVNRKLS